MTGQLLRWPWCRAWVHWVRAYPDPGWVVVLLDHVLALAVVVGECPVELAKLFCPSSCVDLGLETLTHPVTCLVTVEALIV